MRFFYFFTHSAIAVGERFESILKVVWGCWADAGVFRHTFRGVWTGQLVLRNSHQLGRFDLWSPWWRGPSPSHKGGGWFWTLHKRDKGAGHAAVGVGGFPGAGCNTQALEEVWWRSSLQMELLNFRLHFSICLIFQEHQYQNFLSLPVCEDTELFLRTKKSYYIFKNCLSHITPWVMMMINNLQ